MSVYLQAQAHRFHITVARFHCARDYLSPDVGQRSEVTVVAQDVDPTACMSSTTRRHSKLAFA
jgi:hypothetical protein